MLAPSSALEGMQYARLSEDAMESPSPFVPENIGSLMALQCARKK